MLTTNNSVLNNRLANQLGLSNCCGAEMWIRNNDSNQCSICLDDTDSIEATPEDLKDLRIIALGGIHYWFSGDISELTAKVLRDGLRAVIYHDKFDYLDTILNPDNRTEIDFAQVDIEIADVIVQLGLLGEIRYG